MRAVSPQRQDARIIVGLFYETEARKVFCEVSCSIMGLWGHRAAVLWGYGATAVMGLKCHGATGVIGPQCYGVMGLQCYGVMGLQQLWG